MNDVPAPQPAQPAQPAARRLTRAADDKMLGGVCGGLARYLDVDATLVRVLTVVAVIFGVLPVVLAYAALWVLMPSE